MLVFSFTSNMMFTGAELRFRLAVLARRDHPDKNASEVTMIVTKETFDNCLADMPEHHKATARKRGFIRANALPFFVQREDGMMYCHGIVNILLKGAVIRGYVFE